MMKKIVAFMLALLMCASVAMAAEWAEGLSPQKPYAGSPEIDFNESFGYMIFLPMNDAHVAPGGSVLSIYLPREDVKAGEGEVKIFTKENGLVEAIPVSAETMVSRALSDVELEGLIWGGGTVFEIKLAQPLQPNKHYYVQMDKGCIISSDFEVSSPAVSGKKDWNFETEVDSYVEDISVFRTVEGKEDLVKVDEAQVGDTMKVSFTLGEDAQAAAMYCNAGTFLLEETYLEESGEFTVYFPASGEVEWGIVFLTADGARVYSMEYTTVVAPMDLPEEAEAE